MSYLKRRIKAPDPAPMTSVFPTPVPSAPESDVSALFDMIDSGWFNNATGELFTGFPITPSDTVIDVGCGHGGYAQFAARCGAEVIATDVNSAVMDSVHARLTEVATRPVRTLVSDSDPLPLEDATGTRIIALEMLEHVEDPRRVLAELVRVGKPRALYLISVPDPVGESIQRVLAPDCYWARPNHIRVFEREQFRAAVEEAGLKVERTARFGFHAAMWWTLFWAADQELGEPEGPLLASWTRTWRLLMESPKGRRVKKALDDFMPKSQVIIARKSA